MFLFKEMFQGQFVFLKWKLYVSGLVPKRNKNLKYAEHLLYARHGMILSIILISPQQHSYMIGTVILILWIRRLRLIDVKWLAYNHQLVSDKTGAWTQAIWTHYDTNILMTSLSD